MTNITTMRPGEHFMFKNFEWVCLDPNHHDGGVLAIMAKPWAKDVKFCPSDKFADEKGNWNNYRAVVLRRQGFRHWRRVRRSRCECGWSVEQRRCVLKQCCRPGLCSQSEIS